MADGDGSGGSTAGLGQGKSAGPPVAHVVVNSTGDQVRQQFVSLHA
jgi:hypothetical protein